MSIVGESAEIDTALTARLVLCPVVVSPTEEIAFDMPSIDPFYTSFVSQRAAEMERMNKTCNMSTNFYIAGSG